MILHKFQVYIIIQLQCAYHQISSFYSSSYNWPPFTILPSPTPSPLVTTNLLSASMSLFCLFIYFLHINKIIQYLTFSIWLIDNLLNLITLSFTQVVTNGSIILKGFIYLFLERGEGREKERDRNINVWLPLEYPIPGAWPAALACVLTGNQTSDPLVHRPALNPLIHTRAQYFNFYGLIYLTSSLSIHLSIDPYI